MNNYPGCIRLLFALALYLLSSCEGQKYQRAVQLNSQEAFEKYLSRYPNGQFVGKAKEKLDHIIFTDSKKKNTIGSYEYYLGRFQTGFYINTAKAAIDSLLFQEAKKENTIAAYEKYISRSGRNWYTAEAKLAIQKIAAQEIFQDPTIEKCEAFIKKHQSGEQVNLVKEKLQELKYALLIQQPYLYPRIQFLEQSSNNKRNCDLVDSSFDLLLASDSLFLWQDLFDAGDACPPVAKIDRLLKSLPIPVTEIRVSASAALLAIAEEKLTEDLKTKLLAGKRILAAALTDSDSEVRLNCRCILWLLHEQASMEKSKEYNPIVVSKYNDFIKKH